MESINSQPIQSPQQIISQQNRRKVKYTWYVVVGIVLLITSGVSFFFGRMSVKNTSIVPTSTPLLPTITNQVLPTEFIQPSIATTGTVTEGPMPTNQFEVACPPGQYQYGIPLGCVPTTYQCDEKNGGCPICLSGNTTIATPNGGVNVKSIKKGDIVWTLDKVGKKIAAHVEQLSKRRVYSNHKIIYLLLTDKRELFVSPGHPAINGKNVDDLRVGDRYAGSSIKMIKYEIYNQDYTYDLLPAGETGYYFANDIPLGSTLKK